MREKAEEQRKQLEEEAKKRDAEGVKRNEDGEIVQIPGFTAEQVELFTEQQRERLVEKLPPPPPAEPEEEIICEEYVLPGDFKYPADKDNYWVKATWKEVPAEASIVNFVFSNGQGAYENNHGGDFHIGVEADDAKIKEAVEARYLEIREERRQREIESDERMALRKKQKDKFAEQAQALLRKQLSQMLYTEPAVPIPGAPLTIYYNPKDTAMHNAKQVHLRGATNGRCGRINPAARKKGCSFFASSRMAASAWSIASALSRAPKAVDIGISFS